MSENFGFMTFSGGLERHIGLKWVNKSKMINGGNTFV